jgi:hypothetical protein
VTGGAVTTVGDTVTTVGDTVTVGVEPDGGTDTVDVTVGPAVGVAVGLSAPDSVVASAAVPVSAIAAAPMARQPDTRLMRIAISRSCPPDRFVTVMSGNASDRRS